MKRKIVAAALVIAGLCGINAIVNADTDEYSYSASGTTCRLTKYLGNATEVVIPSEYKGYKVVTLSDTFSGKKDLKKVVIPDSVTNIYDHTFNGCTALETVEIPSSVSRIGFCTFKDCDSLTSINIPGNVKLIDGSAFSDCSNLSSVTLDEGVETINIDAFFNCDKIESIYIPKSLKNMDAAFSCCDNLTEIIVDKENPVFESPENSNAIITKSNKKLIQGCKATVIPEGVKSLDYYAFSGIPELDNLKIPDSVTSFGNWVFRHCPDLKTIYVSDNIKSIDVGCFADMPDLESVRLPEDITSVLSYTFQNCPKLTYISIPDKVEKIGDEAFKGCKGLKELKIGKGVKEIGSYAFHQNDSLTTIFYNGSEADWELVTKDKNALPDNLTVRFLDYKILDDSNAEISKYYGTETEVEFPETINGKAVTSIGEEAFKDLTGLSSIAIPDDLTAIKAGAFEGCTSLKMISLPVSIKTIGDNALQTGALEDVYYAGSEEMWNQIAKSSTAVAAGVKIHFAIEPTPTNTSTPAPTDTATPTPKATETVTPTPAATETVTPTPAVTETVTPTPVVTDTVTPTPVVTDTVTPTPAVTAAATATPAVTAIVTPTAAVTVTAMPAPADVAVVSYTDKSGNTYKVTTDGEVCVEHSDGTDVTIPDTVVIAGKKYKVTSIADNAYKNNKKLKKIKIGKNITKIGKNAFFGCIKLKSVTGGKNVVTIGDGAFRKCKVLPKITLYSKVSKIGKDAFRDDKKLKKIVIKSKKLKAGSVGKKAFGNISKKAAFTFPKGKKTAYKKIIK